MADAEVACPRGPVPFVNAPTSTHALHGPSSTPRIVVAAGHPTMRRYICDLIELGCRCWLATTSPTSPDLDEVVRALQPDVVILDCAAVPDLAPYCECSLRAGTLIVIGPTPDDAYRDAAARANVGAWMPRDDVATDLLPTLRRILDLAGQACDCPEPSSSLPEVR